MPRRVRPYGSADDAESAALARGRPRGVSEPATAMMVRDIARQAAEATRALRELTSDGARFASRDDVRDVIAGRDRVGRGLAHRWPQHARVLDVQRAGGQIAT